MGILRECLAFNAVASDDSLIVIAVQLTVGDAVDDDIAGVDTDDNFVHHTGVGCVVSFQQVGELLYIGRSPFRWSLSVGGLAFASLQKHNSQQYVD